MRNKDENQSMELGNECKNPRICKIVKLVFYVFGVAAMSVAFVTDFMCNLHLSWSFLVDASVIYLYLILFPIMFMDKNRIERTAVMFSLGLLPYLYSLEFIINSTLLQQKSYWFYSIGMPISLIWLLVFWIVIAVRRYFHYNWFIIGGIALLLSTVSASFTIAIARNISLYEAICLDFEWIDLLSCIAVSVLFLYIGIKKRHQQRQE